MAPRKRPSSLLDSSVRASIVIINSACSTMEKKYKHFADPSFQYHIQLLRNYLFATLPVHLLDLICSERNSVPLKSDPRIQLTLLAHPSLAAFHKRDIDNMVPHSFWMEHLRSLTKLVDLNLQHICTDDILQVVGKHCLLLCKFNAISKVDVHKSSFNASMLARNVSDGGLENLINLKHLRILTIDPPRSEGFNMQGTKYISQSGIRNVVNHLPLLEELRIESCDIGCTLVAVEFTQRPLNLKRINRHFARSQSVQKIVKLCPKLEDLSLTHLGESSGDEILQILACSDLNLSRLVLSFFPFTNSMRSLLCAKGANLTDFTLWEIGNALNLNDILVIGRCCPNLVALRLITQSVKLIIPRNYKYKESLFKDLKCLYIGSGNFNLEDVLFFFLTYARCLTHLIIKYQVKISFDSTLIKLLAGGFLKNLVFLSLDCTLTVSVEVMKRVIDECASLKRFTASYSHCDSFLQRYIKDKNFDLTLDNYY